jgi:hypothetical protein
MAFSLIPLESKGQVKRKANLLGVLYFVILAHVCLGCGYTVVRDYEEEAKLAELAAIDSLSFAPDLMISNISYAYIPPPPRRDALDNFVYPPEILFTLTIANKGNADFLGTYGVAYMEENPWPLQGHGFHVRRFNDQQDSIKANGEQVIELRDLYPYRGALYTFLILTNPKIQREVKRVDDYFTPGRFHPPTISVTRELRYDNNTDTITVGGLEDLLRDVRRVK